MSLNHEGFDWDLLDTIETQADKFKMTMRIPCYRRCFRIGRSVTLDEAGRCSECGQTWKGPPERPDRYQELSRDHA